ncbi:hypothetical protein J2P12_08740, partial [Candidatus Bathyarchaeota archaeon]|nr:hypothetical protein [Candidatus Bathyarchaeota archaeon]
QSFVTDWAPEALNDLTQNSDISVLFTNVFIPASYDIFNEVLNDAIRTDLAKVIVGVGLDLTDFEVNVVLSAAVFLGEIGLQVFVEQPHGICPKFWEAPPIGELPWFAIGGPGYPGHVYSIYSGRFDFIHDMGLPGGHGVPTAI